MNVQDVLIHALPIIAKLTDGFVAITDSTGNRLRVIDANGNSIGILENRRLGLGEESIKQGKVLSGPSELAKGARIWAIPIGQFALIVTDDGKKHRQTQIEYSLKESLPLIANVIGGEASIFNEIGEVIHSINHDGTSNNELVGQINKDAYSSMTLHKSHVIQSSVLPGGKSILIPISKGLGLELSTLSPDTLDQEINKEGNAKYNFDDIIGKSDTLRKAKELSLRVSKSISPVLLLGESGTGKELFAHSIHNASSRKNHKFVAINCGSIPENLIESILFGYEKGSFTGANPTGKNGLFIEAHKGTIFLDEIAEMDHRLQTRLLRVLQEKEIMPLGSSKTFEVDVRVIAATNKNLKQLIKEGKFREDLYYRLNVIPIDIPSLAERKEDIKVLVNSFIKEYNILLNKRITGCSHEAMNKLLKYQWPGNVRQLRNAIERAINVVDAGFIEVDHLPDYIFNEERQTVKEINYNQSLDEAIKRFEQEYISEVLAKTQFNKQEAANQLGVSTTTLWRKINNSNSDYIERIK
ncbi:sigma-54 interaction domain-containing protein [Mesobacillus harenae]|uniref:sigma-54 interaction domain-containing protein n=1 Tax=Mesobacillus harenae TaxID=2213203 RepID=UPI001580B14E|nr:sigma 54-interacting transcriptional regulator [Mesobacillus harenae]